MAKSTESAVGGIVGFVLAIVLLGGIAGTPFYLAQLRSDSDSLDAAVQEDVEAIRRIVAHIDEHLSAAKDIRDSAEEDSLVTPESVADLEAGNPNLYAYVIKLLKPTTDALQKAIQADRQRGTEAADAGSRRPTDTIVGRQAVLDVQNKYLKETDALLADARKIAARLKTVRQGDASASSHLGVNRVLAILNFTEGRVHANRAYIQRQRAAELRDLAEARLAEVASTKSAVSQVESESEEDVLQNVSDQITQTDAALAMLAEAVSGLKGRISAKEAELSKRLADAAAARQELAELERRGFVPAQSTKAGEEFSAYREQYLAINERARRADAAAAALSNGTLAGARLSEEADGDFLTGKYEGGKGEPGLRDLRLGLAAQESAVSALEKRKAGLQEQQTELEARAKLRSRQKSELDSQAETQIADAATVFGQSEEFDKLAAASLDSAMLALEAAEKDAAKAVAAAKNRTRTAREAIAGTTEGSAEHPFKAIADDKEVEASMQVLSAEIAYHKALLLRDQIDEIRAHHDLAVALAVASSRNPPEAVTSQLDELRSRAIEALTGADSAYTIAENLVKSSRVTTASGTFQGQDYVWQVQVAHAAVHLLKANLATDDTAARASRTAAYDLLRQATEGREQSPLLAQAVDSLVYLQQTAR